MGLYVYVHMYYMYIGIQVNSCIHIYICIFIYVCVYIYMYLCISVCVYMYIYICKHVCLYVYMFYVYMIICLYVYVNVCVYIYVDIKPTGALSLSIYLSLYIYVYLQSARIATCMIFWTWGHAAREAHGAREFQLYRGCCRSWLLHLDRPLTPRTSSLPHLSGSFRK